jgi:4-aminobutyrate aminotransferase/(S)-3-amino-2-methylpropionate transaminase
MTAGTTGGQNLPQERRLVTAIPGPRSRELAARQSATVARGVSTTLPVFITQAGGGVLVDVDGNSLIDFGAGITVVNVGNAAEHAAADPARSAGPDRLTTQTRQRHATIYALLAAGRR